MFTVCDNAASEVCPVWPGQPMTAHWGVPDPAAVEGTEAEIGLAFSDAFRQLNNRISIFVNLPLTKLDRLSLQRRLDEIGKTKSEGRPMPETKVTIYHNPNCETSRNTLGLIRNAGIEPEIIEYLKTPPSREKLLAI